MLNISVEFQLFAAKHHKPKFKKAALSLEGALASQLLEGRTRDLGGEMNCDAFAAAVADKVPNHQ